jgi:hypothetical protein
MEIVEVVILSLFSITSEHISLEGAILRWQSW